MAVALAPEAAVSTKEVAVQLVDVTKVFGSGEQAVVFVYQRLQLGQPLVDFFALLIKEVGHEHVLSLGDGFTS